MTTPVERHGTVWIKRDDLYAGAPGVNGGKGRTILTFAGDARGLTTAGGRDSATVALVARAAKARGIPCRVHVPAGATEGDGVRGARLAGAEVVFHRPGYGSQVAARARDDAAERDYVNIPYMLACPQAVESTRSQVRDIPDGVRRIVVPVGSGMSLAGILHGLRDAGLSIPVVGVVVGADPTRRLRTFAPGDWETTVTLIPAGLPYHKPAPVTLYDGIGLDPLYEAKCVPFLQPEDLFWVIGHRGEVTP